jgi:dihydroorotate dehydrogenase (fumarate)/dihydroorotate dehydrogenase
VRYPKTFSMADAMGMPSDGRERCAERLRRFKPSETPLFVNVAGFSPEDIVASVLAIAPHADAVEITIMCPNLKASNHAEEMEILSGVLDRLEGCARPIVIRIPNEAARSEDRLAEMIERCVAGGVAGLKIGNGRQVAAPQLGVGQGTLHGRDIFEGAVANVARAVRLSRGRLSIKANGGISSGGDVVTMLRAGAACVDIYSAFIYRGWSVARAINRELLAELKLLGRDASHVGQAVV